MIKTCSLGNDTAYYKLSKKSDNIRCRYEELFENIESELTDQNYFDLLKGLPIIKKDIYEGDIFKIKEVSYLTSDGMVNVMTDSYLNVPFVAKKEKKFLIENFNIPVDSDFERWLLNNKDLLVGMSISIIKNNGNYLGSLSDAYTVSKYDEFMDSIKSNKVYEAKIIDRNQGGFMVTVDGFPAFLPGSLASANKIVDFDGYLGKVIPVMFETYIKEGNTYIVSHKKYLKNILQDRITSLDINKKYEGRITGAMKFGLFIEFEGIYTGLLHYLEMNAEFYQKFRSGYYKENDIIEFYISSINQDNKIVLSTKPKLDWDIFKEANEGKVMAGTIKGLKDFGVFVEFDMNGMLFTGLYSSSNPHPKRFMVGSKMNFNINKVVKEDRKIYINPSNN